MKKVQKRQKVPHYKYLAVITGLFVAVLIISNIASTKVISLFGLTMDGGTLLFPLSYIFGDVLTEVYGYKQSRKVIWTGVLSLILLVGVLTLVQLLPAAPEWTSQLAFEQILGMTPRIVLASIIAYFAGEFSNSFTLAKLKIITKGKALWTRTISSTIIGEAVDSILFCLIAFFGLFPIEVVIGIIISNYIFKVAIEIIFTPITYKIVGFLKKEENEDYFDTKTNFNPFIFSEK